MVREFSGSTRTNRSRLGLAGSNSNNNNNNNIATSTSMTTNNTNTPSSSRQTDKTASVTADESLIQSKSKSSVKVHDSKVNNLVATIASEANPKEAMDTSDCNSEADEVTEDTFPDETKVESKNSSTLDNSNQPESESDQTNQPESKDIIDPIIDEIITKGIDKLTTSTSTINSGVSLIETAVDGSEASTNDTSTASSNSQRTNIRFVRKSLENTTLSVLYSKNYYDTDNIETEYPRNFDDNIELLSRETEHLEEQFTASEEKLLHYVPLYDPKKFEEQRKQQKKDKDKVEDEDEPIGMSPCGRFFKYDKEVGRGSFKTVFRGLDTQTGVAVAWCELLVSYKSVSHKIYSIEELKF